MTFIKTNFVIKRNIKTGKKFYTHLTDKRVTTYPPLPKWRDIETSTATMDDDSFVIRPDDDLIVIDCDTIDATALISELLLESEVQTYTTLSDNGTKHFYFAPTPYFRESPLRSDSRVTADKIDILQGGSLVYPACASNATKTYLEGSLDNLHPIPNDLVDILISRQTKDVSSQQSDYEPDDTFRGPLIETALALFARTGNYKTSLQSLMSQITPKRYRPLVLPDFHPDNIPEGEGINYLQALTSRIAGDASISPELHREFITLIAQKLWSSPLSTEALNAHLSNLTTQTINGVALFRYNQNYNSGPLVSIDGQAYKQLCRDADDQYYTIRASGRVQMFQGFIKFAKALKSKNYSLMIDGKIVHNIKEDALLHHIQTAEIMSSKKFETGLIEHADGTLTYNTYQPTRYLNIIRGLEDADIPSGSPEKTFPTIHKILTNLAADSTDKDKLLGLLYQFLSHKYKTFDYSPLVLQLLGIKGTGKNIFISQILGAIDDVPESNINSNNNQFNANFDNASFILHDEDIVLKNTMDYIKKISGKNTIRIEVKGGKVYEAENTATIICTSNRAESMKEGLDDRRIVMLMSFSAERLTIPHLSARIATELDGFCRYLRDTKLLNYSTYMDANCWRDDASDELVEEKNGGSAVSLALLISKVESNIIKSGAEFVKLLNNIIDGRPYYRLGTGQCIYIPLSTNGALISESEEPIRTPLTAKEAKEAGLGKYIKRNTRKKSYTKAVYEIVVIANTELFISLDSLDGMNVTPLDIDGF